MTTAPITDERRTSWLELFFDLAFAGAVAEMGSTLSADYTPPGALRFGFLFVLIWSAWVGHTTFSSRFPSDDLVQRLLTLLQMFAVAVMAVNAEGPLDGRTSAGFAAAYAGLRLVLAGQYLRAAGHLKAGEPAGRHAIGIAAGAVLWLASSAVAPPLRYVLWGTALVLDVAVLHGGVGRGRFRAHPTHLSERFGLFTLILLGESLVGIMAGMKHQEYWSAAAAGSAALGMGISFAIWWCYYDALQAAAPRRVSARWSAAHLPLGLGIALSSVGIEHVITLDAAHTLPAGGALMLSGGIALVLGALAAIAGSSGAAARRAAGPGLALAFGTLVAGLAGGLLPSVALLGLLLAACLGQVAIAKRIAGQAP